jgi:hypothetical protein
MINVEYIENGKRVIIPSEVWEALQDLAEHIEIYEMVQARKDQPGVHSLDDVLGEEGLSRDDQPFQGDDVHDFLAAMIFAVDT